MQHQHIPMLGFAAYSGTGKTTLLEQLIPLLRQRSLKVGLIKHGHHDFDIDQPGKDSYRLREVGASPVMIVSSRRRAIMTEISPQQEPSLNEQLKHFDQTGLDLLLVEGFKCESFPKIELHRSALDHPFLYPNDSSIFAIASDSPFILTETLPQLNLNQPQQISDFIINQFLQRS